MGGWLSPWHWMFILIIAVLLFGNRLPEIARSLGRSVNEFKRGLKDVKDEFDAAANDDPPERLESSSKDHARLDHPETVERGASGDREQKKEPQGAAASSDSTDSSEEPR